ncbi:MAG TPA: PilZ domain-containing protein [Roseiarcus sp.]
MDNEIDDFSGDNDRRDKDRKIQNIPAWADPGGVLPVVDCQILDISDGGAQVRPVKIDVEMPDAFTLQIDASRSLGEVNVVWRGERSVGVKFAKPGARR